MRIITRRHHIDLSRTEHGFELLRHSERFLLPARQFMLIPYVSANFDLFFNPYTLMRFATA